MVAAAAVVVVAVAIVAVVAVLCRYGPDLALLFEKGGRRLWEWATSYRNYW